MALTSQRFVGSSRLQLAANDQPPLRKGEMGTAVRLIQEVLIELGYRMPVTTAGHTRPPDGVYGDETVRAIWTFQGQSFLQQDGIAGRETLHALDRVAALLPSGRMLQLLANLLEIGRKMLSSPDARLMLGKYLPQVENHLRELEVAIPKDSLPKPEPATIPVVAGVDDLAVLIVLAFAAAATALAMEASKNPPKPPDVKMPKPDVLELTLSLAAAIGGIYAATIASVRKNISQVDACKNNHPEKAEACAALAARFERVAGELLKTLTTLSTTRPGRFPQVAKKADKLRIEFNQAMADLVKCMGCR